MSICVIFDTTDGLMVVYKLMKPVLKASFFIVLDGVMRKVERKCRKLEDNNNRVMMLENKREEGKEGEANYEDENEVWTNEGQARKKISEKQQNRKEI